VHLPRRQRVPGVRLERRVMDHGDRLVARKTSG
jgi:hypothetical protein